MKFKLDKCAIIWALILRQIESLFSKRMGFFVWGKVDEFTNCNRIREPILRSQTVTSR